MNAATAFRGEVDVIGAVIHLGLGARRRLEADDRFATRTWPPVLDAFAHDGVAAGKTLSAQFFEDARGRHVRVAVKQLADGVVVSVELAWPPCGQPSTRQTLADWRVRLPSGG